VKDARCLEDLAALCVDQPALWKLLATADAVRFVVPASPPRQMQNSLTKNCLMSIRQVIHPQSIVPYVAIKTPYGYILSARLYWGYMGHAL
jgi:hypothetical protein